MNKQDTETRMGLFPLNTVLVPGALVPLQVFEPRYLSLVNSCIDNNEEFGIVLIREGNEVRDVPFVYETGTAAEILEWKELPGGMMHILCRGTRRIRVGEISSREDQLMEACVSFPEEPSASERAPNFDYLASYARDMLESMKGQGFDELITYDMEDPVDVVWFLASVVAMPGQERQKILESSSLKERISLLGQNLAGQDHFDA